MTSKPTLKSLQLFRGLAALSVVIHHASVSTDAFVSSVPNNLMKLFDLGALGVDFFFVLSGFIIMHAHAEEAGQLSAIKRYCLKRLMRIFPAYWPVGLGLLSLYIIMPGFSASGGRDFSVISSVILVPTELPPALSVAWTLVHEIMFYALFMTLFFSIYAFIIACFLWAIFIVVAQFFDLSEIGAFRYPLSILNIEFILGVFSAVIHRRGLSDFVGIICLSMGLALSLSMLIAIYNGWPMFCRVIFAASLALLILGILQIESRIILNWPETMLIIGNSSYSIYLLHGPLLSITQRGLAELTACWHLALLFGVIISLVAGYVYYLLLERPISRFSRKFI